jgi:hypothetical protein
LRAVTLDVLNRQRLDIVLVEYQRSAVVLAPAEVAKREKILHWSSK